MPVKTSVSLATFLLLAGASVATICAAQADSPSPAASAQGRDAFRGVWMLNRDKSELSGRGSAPDGPSEGSGRRGGGGRGGRGGSGRGGRGGGGGRDANPEQMQAIANFMQTTMAASDRVTIVVRESSVGITDADGRTLTLQTTNKSVDERAENGLVKISRKSYWTGSTLVAEIKIDNGPTIERKYQLSPAGMELRVSTTLSGAPGGLGGGRNRTLVQVYERPLER